MSNLQGPPGRVSDNGEGCPLTIPQGHGSQACPAQPAVAEHNSSCPYAEKAVTNATTARVILMFLRDFVEQQTVYAQSSQGYYCPMVKCYQAFADPVSLIHHVMSCPELPGGEFQCWKCLQWHELPADEKEWSECAGWKPDVPQGSHFPQKRSLSTKMKDTFLRRKSSTRKVAPGSPIKQDIDPDFQLDARLNPEITGVLSNLAYCRSVCQGIDGEQHRDMPGFHDAQKAIKTTNPSSVDVDMMWSDITPDAICGLPPAAPASQFDQVQSPSQQLPSGLATGLGQTQCHSPLADRTILRSPDQLVAPQVPFSNWPQVQQPSFDCYSHPSSPPMTMNNSMIVGDLAVPPPIPPQIDLAAATTMNEKAPAWLGARAGGDLARLSPVSWRGNDSSSERSIRDGITPNLVHLPPNNYPFAMCSPAIHAPTPRAISSGMPLSSTLAITPDMSTANSSQETLHISPVHNMYAAPVQNPAHVHGMLIDDIESRAASPTPSEDDHGHDDGSDDLVCDQCQWRPRGVKENLKGYLRKHKNVHKGLRLPCDFPNCKKTFSRLDNLKKHRREKHGLEETGAAQPVRRPQDDCGHGHTHIHTHTHEEHAHTHGVFESPMRDPRDSSENSRGVFGDHSVLWPGLHL